MLPIFIESILISPKIRLQNQLKYILNQNLQYFGIDPTLIPRTFSKSHGDGPCFGRTWAGEQIGGRQWGPCAERMRSFHPLLRLPPPNGHGHGSWWQDRHFITISQPTMYWLWRIYISDHLWWAPWQIVEDLESSAEITVNTHDLWPYLRSCCTLDGFQDGVTVVIWCYDFLLQVWRTRESRPWPWIGSPCLARSQTVLLEREKCVRRRQDGKS